MEQTSLLKELGLSDKETKLYMLLLGLGPVRVRKIVQSVDMPRGTVYEILSQLTQKKLVEELLDAKNITIYRPRHPYALKELIEEECNRLKLTENKLDAVIPDFINLYSQAQQRQGVKFIEGEAGVKKALQDSLGSKTEILTIADIEAVNTHIKEINEEYIKRRNKKGIQKRLLAIDNEYSRNRYKNSKNIIDVRLLTTGILPFNTSLQIYDDKIAYITMTKDHLTSTIINNPYIYSMQKALFETMWSNAEPLYSSGESTSDSEQVHGG
jgi:sugar-specific transcriptional regulator TrmB